MACQASQSYIDVQWRRDAQKLEGRCRKDGGPAAFDGIEATEVPALRAHVLDIARQGRIHSARALATGLSSFVVNTGILLKDQVPPRCACRTSPLMCRPRIETFVCFNPKHLWQCNVMWSARSSHVPVQGTDDLTVGEDVQRAFRMGADELQRALEGRLDDWTKRLEIM